MRPDVAAEGEDCVEVDLDHLVEVRVGELLAGVAPLDACAVDEDAYLVAVCEDSGDELGDVLGRRQVCGVDLGLATQGLDGF